MSDGMQVTYIDHMGNDLSVVNSARVSFHKESELVKRECSEDDPHGTPEFIQGMYQGSFKETLSEADEKLVKYLATHGHWTPFSHTSITFRIKAPIVVARQLFKHKVGFTENEVSRRYVDEDPEFYWPKVWRGKPVNKKQGSTGEIEDPQTISEINYWVESVYELSETAYLNLLEYGLCPEQARLLLPQGMMTEWFWTGSLSAYARMCQLRMSDDAQKETRDVAEKIYQICEDLYPVSWRALNGAD